MADALSRIVELLDDTSDGSSEDTASRSALEEDADEPMPLAAPALLPHQVAHVGRLNAIWSERCFYLDTSPMGTGKTHAAAWLIRQRAFAHVIIVCPLAVKSMWTRVLALYGVKPDVVVTYETLRSKRGCQPAHGLLTRTDSAADAGKATSAFTPTPRFQQLVREGVCLVADEFQRIKNRSAQQQAMQALCREVAQSARAGARIALLSGTPFDKREQVLRLLQLVIVIYNSRMYTFHAAQARLELHGAEEVVQCAQSIDADATRAVLERTPFSRSNMAAVCYELYVRVIQRAVTSCMAPPVATVELRCVNGFYDVPRADVDALQASIRALHSATKFDPETANVALADADWYAISRALHAIESAKVNMFVRLAKAQLDAHPCAKVVVALQYLEPIARVAAALAEFAPLVLTGAVTPARRDVDIAAFQAHDSAHRLIVGNLAVLELGIDLDDTHGGFPRTAFASPGYAVMRVHQFTRRFHRVHTRSPATVAFVFGKCASVESSILNALRRKTEVLSDTLQTQVAHGMRFPGDYDVFVEPTDDDADEAAAFDTATILKHVQPNKV